MFNINEFKAAGLRWGGARPSLFQVILTPPAIAAPAVAAGGAGIGAGAIGLDVSSSFSFLCRAAELPEMTLSNIEVPYFGRKIKVAGERSYADWTVTVMNDEDFNVRAMFEAWSNAINSVVGNLRSPGMNAEQYKTNVEVIQYGKDGSILRSYNIVGAFPTTIGAIALDWETANAIETFSVNFAYDYWLPGVEINTKGGGVTMAYYAQTGDASRATTPGL